MSRFLIHLHRSYLILWRGLRNEGSHIFISSGYANKTASNNA